MNVSERHRLKQDIEADLEYLIDESWHDTVIKQLSNVLSDLRKVGLGGYDD